MGSWGDAEGVNKPFPVKLSIPASQPLYIPLRLRHTMFTLANSYSSVRPPAWSLPAAFDQHRWGSLLLPRDLRALRPSLSHHPLILGCHHFFSSSFHCENVKDICLPSIYLSVGRKEEERGETSLLLMEASWSFASWSWLLAVFGWVSQAWDSDSSSQFLWPYVIPRSLPRGANDSRVQVLNEWAYLINGISLSLMQLGVSQ